ncbi:MAG: M55 family metallopeptidase [Candidatus Melainabacteria bacterium]|nr:M55 family metallopeptidase [Candidatus Melainabacteria bacterium]
MKILISADLEGVSGVVHPDQLQPGSDSYKEAVMRWCQELNAIVAGLREAGATHIVICDAHHHMRNINNALIPNATIVTGWQRQYSMMSQIDQGFDACFLTGYHAMAGSKSTLSHTYRPRVIKQVMLNKIPVGELGLNAALAGFFNVPIAFVSGDEELCIEAQKILGNQIIAVQTKKGLSRYSALSYPFEKTLTNLKEHSKRALKEKEKWQVYKVQSPCTITVTFSEPNHADACELIPEVRRVSDNQVEYTGKLYPIAFRCFLAMGALAVARDEVIT